MGTWMITLVTAFIGLVTAPVYSDSPICKASRLHDLREALSSQRLTNISYIIVNDRNHHSMKRYSTLKQHAGKEIPVYQQVLHEPDVWKVLNGDKDDFLIYDRCGQLTFHLMMPYSFLHFPYVEAAILETYYKDRCGNCSIETVTNITESTNETLPSTSENTANNGSDVVSSGGDQEQHHHHHEGHTHGGSSSQCCGQKHSGTNVTSPRTPEGTALKEGSDVTTNGGDQEHHHHHHQHSPHDGHSHEGSSSQNHHQPSAKKAGQKHSTQQQQILR